MMKKSEEPTTNITEQKTPTQAAMKVEDAQQDLLFPDLNQALLAPTNLVAPPMPEVPVEETGKRSRPHLKRCSLLELWHSSPYCDAQHSHNHSNFCTSAADQSCLAAEATVRFRTASSQTTRPTSWSTTSGSQAKSPRRG